MIATTAGIDSLRDQGFLVVQLDEPQACLPEDPELRDEVGCTNRPERCTCTIPGGCGESSEAGCCWCRHGDPYEGCPLFGGMCDPRCGDPDACCTPAQQLATRAHYALLAAAREEAAWQAAHPGQSR